MTAEAPRPKRAGPAPGRGPLPPARASRNEEQLLIRQVLGTVQQSRTLTPSEEEGDSQKERRKNPQRHRDQGQELRRSHLADRAHQPSLVRPQRSDARTGPRAKHVRLAGPPSPTVPARFDI